MKIVLSRKGFDSAAGGVPSPILGGRPRSIPIPATRSSSTTYADLGLGEIVERITRGRILRTHLCHHDPTFVGERCIFGQCDVAQTHLANQKVGVGDTFVFFGLFAEEATAERHHRIFGYLRVEQVHPVVSLPEPLREELVRLRHPHVLGNRFANNTIYTGEGRAAHCAPATLRLTRVGGPISRWTVPDWLGEYTLSYHPDPRSRVGETELQAASRGQEFVCDVADALKPSEWLKGVIAAIRG